jgi:hypothetical protein
MNKPKNARKFITGESVRVALTRLKIKRAGSTATFLLESFLENNGRILASQVVARGICEDGKFRDWRKVLIEKGWLIWSEAQDDKGQYFCGKKLVPYINKEKIAQKELATRESVEKVRSDLNSRIDTKADRSEVLELKAKMHEIADAVQKLQIASIPPDSEQKNKIRKEQTKVLADLTKDLRN